MAPEYNLGLVVVGHVERETHGSGINAGRAIGDDGARPHGVVATPRQIAEFHTAFSPMLLAVRQGLGEFIAIEWGHGERYHRLRARSLA